MNNMSSTFSMADKLKLEELSDRFYDLTSVIKIKIDHRGYVPEVKCECPFIGRSSIRSIINMLDRDINVIIPDNSDLRKLRNSITFFNDYFCGSEENVEGYVPAVVAIATIEFQYRRRFNMVEVDVYKTVPYFVDVLADIMPKPTLRGEVVEDDINASLQRYLESTKAVSIGNNDISDDPNEESEIEGEGFVPVCVLVNRNIGDGMDIGPLNDDKWDDVEF